MEAQLNWDRNYVFKQLLDTGDTEVLISKNFTLSQFSQGGLEPPFLGDKYTNFSGDTPDLRIEIPTLKKYSIDAFYIDYVGFQSPILGDITNVGFYGSFDYFVHFDNFSLTGGGLVCHYINGCALESSDDFFYSFSYMDIAERLLKGAHSFYAVPEFDQGANYTGTTLEFKLSANVTPLPVYETSSGLLLATALLVVLFAKGVRK